MLLDSATRSCLQMAGPVDYSKMPKEVADFLNINTSKVVLDEHYMWEHTARISYTESAYYVHQVTSKAAP